MSGQGLTHSFFVATPRDRLKDHRRRNNVHLKGTWAMDTSFLTHLCTIQHYAQPPNINNFKFRLSENIAHFVVLMSASRLQVVTVSAVLYLEDTLTARWIGFQNAPRIIVRF